MRSPIIIAGALLCALLPLTGCGGSGDSTALPVRSAVGRSVPAKSSLNGFSVTVQTDKTTYAVGEPIQITVTATNTGASARTLRYPTSFAYHRWGYIIAQNDKIVTYEYWDGHREHFPTILGMDTYTAGEARTFAYRFPYLNLAGSVDNPTEQLPAGTYQVYARMPELVYTDDNKDVRYSEPTPASVPVTITIQ